MANMSYCRWENTANDLVDCVTNLEFELEEGKTLQEFYDSLGSEYEKRAFKQMIAYAKDFVTMTEDFSA